MAVEHCAQEVGTDLEDTCTKACGKSCYEEVALIREEQKRLGFTIDRNDEARLINSCKRVCSVQALKPGQIRPFAINFRLGDF